MTDPTAPSHADDAGPSLDQLVAGCFAFPVNRWLLARGQGHAVAHQYHHAH
jgi:hypothetical protein